MTTFGTSRFNPARLTPHPTLANIRACWDAVRQTEQRVPSVAEVAGEYRARKLGRTVITDAQVRAHLLVLGLPVRESAS